MVAKAMRRSGITRAGGSAGVTPSRSVAECIGAVAAAVARSPPTAACLKRSAQDAAFRARRKARLQGGAGFVANYNSLEEMAVHPNVMIRPGADEFLRYDGGPGAARILLIGAASYIAAMGSETVWVTDGNFNSPPNLRAKICAIHASVEGYCLPCVYAPPG